MARSRNLKPGFFTNDLLAECDPLARLMFAGLWTIADSEGRLEDRPRKIKAEVLPYDDCSPDALLDQLAHRAFIHRYVVGETRLIQICNFRKHQTPHQKEPGSQWPEPGAGDRGTSLVQVSDLSSTRTRQVRDQSRSTGNEDSVNVKEDGEIDENQTSIRHESDSSHAKSPLTLNPLPSSISPSSSSSPSTRAHDERTRDDADDDFSPSYPTTMGKSWEIAVKSLSDLFPELVPSRVEAMLGDVERDVGPLSKPQLQHGFAAAFDSLKRSNGSVVHVRPYVRKVLTERLREVANARQ
jgi:hypothetical protein